MSEQTINPAIPTSKPTPAWRMVLSLSLVAVICGLIILFANLSTFEAIKNNKRILLERGINKVIPGASAIQAYNIFSDGTLQQASLSESPPSEAIRFFAAYSSKKELMGIAAEGSSSGYADQVRVLYAWSPQCQCINGFAVVAMRETPGIGDKILEDKVFLANFEKLAAGVDGQSLANEITTVKHGSKANPWEIDAIAGATITSRAVGKGINQSAQRLLPLLLPQLNQLQPK